jgi:hypothetical protein
MPEPRFPGRANSPIGVQAQRPNPTKPNVVKSININALSPERKKTKPNVIIFIIFNMLRAKQGRFSAKR